MRLGQLERQVLRAILESRDAPEAWRPRCRRYGRRPGSAFLIDVRDRMWGREVTASQRAGLSRALRTLSSKGLIRSLHRYTTQVELTLGGEAEAQNVNKAARATLLTPEDKVETRNVNNDERSTLLTSQGVAP